MSQNLCKLYHKMRNGQNLPPRGPIFLDKSELNFNSLIWSSLGSGKTNLDVSQWDKVILRVWEKSNEDLLVTKHSNLNLNLNFIYHYNKTRFQKI